MADKLLPCPFCGGEARILTDMQDTTTPVFSVVCDECESITYFGDVLDKEGTVEAWNNRTSPWHTGTPTEDGYYLLHMTIYDEEYDLCVDFKDGTWDDRKWGFGYNYKILAYQKIEPFVEASNGTDN